MKRPALALALALLAAPVCMAQCPALGWVDGAMSGGRLGSAGTSRWPAASAIHFESYSGTLPYGTGSISQDFDFAQYLLENSLLSDALTLVASPYEPSDTLAYLRGTVLFESKYLAESSAQFALVGESSGFYDKSLYYAVLGNAHLGSYAACNHLLDTYSGPYSDLLYLNRSAVALLQRDYAAFEASAARVGNSHYAVSEAARELVQIGAHMRAFKPKSVAVAGLASAVVPGLGKVYAGKTGEGVAAFLCVAGFGAITAENWAKCGPGSWKTILFGALGATCYIANIYGSCVSVQVYNQRMYQNYETSVLVNLHIPLRRLFE